MRPDLKSVPRTALCLIGSGRAFLFALSVLATAAHADTPLKRCTACHEVRDADQVIVKGGKSGPNLFGVIGRRAGSADGFAYSDDLAAAGRAGLIYDRETLAAFTTNPNAFLSDVLGRNARSKMPLRFPKEAEAAAAYLAKISG